MHEHALVPYIDWVGIFLSKWTNSFSECKKSSLLDGDEGFFSPIIKKIILVFN